MLVEELYLENIELVSINTDGVVIHYTKEQEQIVKEIWKKWEEKTTYTLEDTYYNQIIFSSVNDYIAEIINPLTGDLLYNKYKGDFEIDKEWHKNNSQRIVPIALKRYFIDNIPIKETITNHINVKGYDFNSKTEKFDIVAHGIYDFCIGKKNNFKVDGYRIVNGDNVEIIEDKVIRYYISNSNDKLFKLYSKEDSNRIDDSNAIFQGNSNNAIEAVNKGFNITLFMDYEEKNDYNINYAYYINECNKIIKEIEKKKIKFTKLELF